MTTYEQQGGAGVCVLSGVHTGIVYGHKETYQKDTTPYSFVNWPLIFYMSSNTDTVGNFKAYDSPSRGCFSVGRPIE